ncbi:MAG TPA: Sec-independent protein translocase protein TatB [Actinomycetota bacterium]|nr:Sec-independent protein translocase protein TatB [Actinomycetota bacterium]
MPQIGPLEILVVGVIALIVFGPKRLPELARSVGRALAEFRRQATEIRSEFTAGLDDDEPARDTNDESEGSLDEEASEQLPRSSGAST